MLADTRQPVYVDLDLQDYLRSCTLYDHLQSAVAVVDCSGVILYQNDGFRSFNLYDPANQGNLANELLGRETMQESIVTCCTSGRAIELTEKIDIDTTTSYPIHILLQPVVYEPDSTNHGVLVSVAEGSLDVLRSRLALYEKQQQELVSRIRELSAQSHAKEKLIQSLFSDAPFSIMIMDTNRRIVRMNHNCEELLGAKAGQVFGNTCDTYLSCYKDHNRCIACDEKEQRIFGEGKFYDIDGREHDILKSTVHHSVENESFILEAFIDITERKKLYELEKNKEREVLEAAAKSKSQFYASLSHELRTPLNAILGYSEILLEDSGEDSQLQKDLINIHSAGSHLLELVNGLLDISKIESGKLEPLFENVDWKAVCNDVIRTINPMAEKNNNALDIQLADEEENIVTDKLRLRQILLNLLDNACKFTRHGKVSLYAKMKASTEGGIIQFTVKDTGIGMSKDQLEKVFLEYEQADRTISKEYGGTGLGLPICNRLTRLLGGSLRADSTPGEGSTITVELPTRKPALLPG